MLAKPFTQKLFDKMPERIFFQPKIDGDRIKAIPLESGYKLVSSSGKEMPCLPHINKELDSLFKDYTLSLKPTLDGEGYVHGMPQQDIHSICSRKKNLHPDSKTMQYYIFDMVSELNQYGRTQLLIRYLSYHNYGNMLKFLPTTLASKGDLDKILSSYIVGGYEGAIIRDPSASYNFGKQSCILKLKPTKEASCLIVDVFEAISKEGKLKEILGALELQDSHGRTFCCGAGCLTHHQRLEYWEQHTMLYGKIAHIKYLTLTKDNIPREPILLKITD